MLDEKKLNIITSEVKEVMRSSKYSYPTTDEEEMSEILYTLRSHIASLHNLLYEQVKGERYDYMVHWCNKIGSYVDDDVYDELLKQEEKKNGSSK